jgi:hypothetical protein
MCINLWTNYNLSNRWKLATTAHFLKTISKNMGLAEGNVYDEVENLFESVYRIYEQRHSQVDYKFIIIFLF